MDHSFLKFSSHTVHTPPTVDFSFVNPNAPQPKGISAQGFPAPNGQAGNGSSPVAQRKAFGPGVSDASMKDCIASSRTAKPGPISKSEWSSGTNAFKLRTNNAPNAQNTTSNNLLRQEVFKSAHTLAPQAQQPKKPSPSLLSSTPRVPRSENLPVKFSAKSLAGPQRVPVELPKQDSTFKLESPSSGQLQPRAKPIRMQSTTNGDYPKQRTPSLPSTMDDCSSTLVSSDDVNGPDVHLVETPGPAPRFSSTLNEHFPSVIPPTPSRHSLDRATPSNAYEDASEDADELTERCQVLEAMLNAERNRKAKLQARIPQLEAEKVQAEEELSTFKSQYSEKLKSISAQNAASRVELESLGDRLKSSAVQSKQLFNDVSALKKIANDAIASILLPTSSTADEVESKNPLAREIFADYEELHLELTSQLSQRNQTIDILRDELSVAKGNFTQSLEREKELQASLIAMGGKHAEVAKCLTTLHAQHDSLNFECSNLRSSESSATERIADLEREVADLTTDNNRTEELLSENEKAFAQKLKHLEDENDAISQALQTARSDLTRGHSELEGLRATHDEALAQIELLRGQREDLTGKVALLEREVELKVQCLSEARELKESFEAQLAELNRNLVQSRAESDRLQGRLGEVEKTYSARIDELKHSLESALERESSLKSDAINSNNDVASLQEKLKGATAAYARVGALESSLSQKEEAIGRLNIELASVKLQLSKAEESRDAQISESKSALAACHVAREQNTILRAEVEALGGLFKAEQQATHKLSTKTAQDEVEIRQLKNQLAKEQERRSLVEQKLGASTQGCRELQAEHKALIETSSAKEKTLRLSMEDAQNQVQRLEIERAAQEDMLEDLRRDLSEATSAKSTLEALVEAFQRSIQQQTSTRQEYRQTIETQESKITNLTDHVSEQKAEIRGLERQLAGLDSRCAEYKADVNAHRIAAETARATTSILEDRFKQKELELDSLRAKLQTLESMSVEAAARADDKLQAKVLEQEAIIEHLRSKGGDTEKNAEPISERYRGGKLTPAEKELIGTITNGILQEKNKAVNNLKGEIKRKENEIETFKTNIADLKDSLAKQIKQTANLKAKLTLNSGPGADPQGWHGFVNRFPAVSSSPLSYAGPPAPDHDEPVPDAPVTPSKPTGAHAYQLPQQQRQQHRTFAQMDIGSGNGADEIQEFEEPPAHEPSSVGRKRPAAEIEGVEEVEVEQNETKRKAPGKNKKVGRPPKDTTNPKGQPVTETLSHAVSTRTKPTKRRKGC